MTHPTFDRYQLNLLGKVIKMKDTKGKEYSNDDGERFANFNRLAAALNMTNIQIAWVYLAKHLDSIASYCRTGKSFSEEGIEGRIVDTITYLTLIAGMIEENQRERLEPERLKNSVAFNSDEFVPLQNISSEKRKNMKAAPEAVSVCEICTQLTTTPVSMNFCWGGGKEMRWLICEGCTLILTKYIKKMANAK